MAIPPETGSTASALRAAEREGDAQDGPWISQPSYAGLFRCIGPECEDTCCGGWDIPVDKVTFQAYQRFPAEKLGNLVARYVRENPSTRHDTLYAYIRRKEDGQCPFFGPDRLCGIQKEHGVGLLSSTCSLYPRALTVVNGVLEGSLSLSCPEAARAVLLFEGSTKRSADLSSGEFRTDNVFRLQQRPGLDELFLPIRALVTALIRDRSRPKWQSLLLIVSLCSHLDGSAGEGAPDPSQLLKQYSDAVGRGPSPELDQMAPDIATRLELAIGLSNARCQDRDCGQRFRNVFWDFIEGIGSAGGESGDEDIDRFIAASREHLEPLLARYPYILENYLLNYVYQHGFPFGRTGSDRFLRLSMADEAVLLVTQFAWWTTLLTGVAGRYGGEFCETHVIAAVQSFTRAVEHTPMVLEDALAFVKARNLHSLAGLARLLRT